MGHILGRRGRRHRHPEGPHPAHRAGGLGGRLTGRALRRHPGTQSRPRPRRGRARARAAPHGGRGADGRDAGADEGRRDEDRPTRLVHRHRVPASGVPRALPGQARHAALHGAADAVEEGAGGARRGVGGSRGGALRGLRARRRRGRLDRPGAQGGATGRQASGGEGAVPRRGGGDRGRHAERRADPAARQGLCARARREGRGRGAEGARDGGARLRARGAVAARLRARLPAPPVHPRAGRCHAAVHRARAGERVGGRRRLRRGARAAAGRARPLRRDRVPVLLRLDLPPPALQRRRPPGQLPAAPRRARRRSSTSG